MSSPLLNLPYFGNVAHWAAIAGAEAFILEAWGPYQRRTFRTRSSILTTDGPLDISVPVHTGHSLLYKDVLLNYDTPWQRQHVYALETAYNSTPFFEFMIDDFRDVYSRKYEHLWDFNMAMMLTVARLAGIKLNFSLTDSFAPPVAGVQDFRVAIEPKMSHVLNSVFKPVPYYQVFATPYTDKPFTPWMSILDMLFNMGPESRDVLRSMQPIR